MFFMVDNTKQKLLFENYECFPKTKKKCRELVFAEDTYLGLQRYRYEPGFDQSVLKIFVVNANLLFAKYGKQSTFYYVA